MSKIETTRRGLLRAGAASRPGTVADANYFDALRSRVQKSASV